MSQTASGLTKTAGRGEEQLGKLHGAVGVGFVVELEIDFYYWCAFLVRVSGTFEMVRWNVFDNGHDLAL